MTDLKQKYIGVLESKDWVVDVWSEKEGVELRTITPAGEDFGIFIEAENFPEKVADYAEDFDTEEHVEMWINARRNGYSGVPSIRELVDDADAIKAMLQDLATELKAVK